MTLVRRYVALVLPTLVLACLSQIVSAQSRFDVWNTDTGLPQNTVQDILQTSDGYLWLTTSDGLVRFDGAQFTVFNSGNSPGLETNRFSCLYEDSDGILWIGTEDSGLTKYKDEAFTTYSVADGLPANWVLQILKDPDLPGGLLVRTNAGIVRWPDKRMVPRGERDTPPTTHVRYVDQEGNVWFYDGSALHRIKDGSDTVYAVADGLSKVPVTSLFRTREGSLWIALADSSLQRLRNGAFRNYTKRDGLPESNIRFFYEDRQGDLWFGTTSDGLVRLRYGTDDSRYDAAPHSERIRRYTTADGLSGDSIRVIYEDVEGSLWVGTSASGLNRLRKQIVATFSKRDGLGGDNVYPVYHDRAGSVWMGTWPNGLTVYKGGAFTRYNNRDGLVAGDLVTSLAEDRQGRLWVGGYNGISWFENGKFATFPEKLALQGGGVSAIYQDQTGAFWFGTDAAGLYKYLDGTLTRLTTQNGLPSDSVRVIIEDRQHNIWLGTYGGLVKFKDGKFTVYTTMDGLASNRVRALYEDALGTLWVGTFDGGLSRYKEGRFTSYTTRQGLFNSGVFQVLEDNQENLWLSCNLGIYRVSKRELNDYADGKIHAITSIAYGKADGMLNQECNGGVQPAGIKTRDGKLWFPTQTGVAIVDPEAIPFNSHPPPVIIESVQVDRADRNLRVPLRIEPGQTSLEIHYTGLSFIKPEQIKFKYRLEGIDNDWVEAGNRRVAYYSHVPPGNYVFRVIAANANGVWNTQGAQLDVQIRPPFYRTNWFLALSIASIIGAAVSFYRWRVAHLENERAVHQAFSQQLIESQESERKRIAFELHDGLGQSLVVIRNRALISLDAPANQDRLLAQMGEISEAAAAAITEVRGIARNLHPYQIEYLGLTTALKTMIDSVAGASQIELVAEIDEIDGKLSKEGEINLYRIVQEGLNNVVKHSEATKGRVALKRNGLVLDLLIEDNGKGFAAGSENQKSGLGLVGIGERARLIDAHYEISSTAGNGTVIHLRMKLPEEKHET